MAPARPSETSYEVRIWNVEVYRGARLTSYRLQWVVRGKRFSKSFRTRAALDSFRSELTAAQRQGVAFDVSSGLPVTMTRQALPDVSWYEFACTYVDRRWADISPKHRKGIAEVLATFTIALLRNPVDPATAKTMRSALLNWGFNRRRGAAEQPRSVSSVLATIARQSRPLSDLMDGRVVRDIIDVASRKVNGERASQRTAAWRRSVLSTALSFAVEQGMLEENLVAQVKLKRARSSAAVDRRVVVNPSQARALLDAVAVTPKSGHLMVAFFAAMYYSALRPEEAVWLRASNLQLPDDGWGWIVLDASASEVDRQWTDSNQRREHRELKHRAPGDSRRVPCPPQLVSLLRAHLAQYGAGQTGLLFRGLRGGPLSGVTYTDVWDRARKAALTAEQYQSPLARRPYDLRHAAVSTWLNSGVPATQVAEWAGHSVEVLLRVYAKCMDGGEAAALQRLDGALRGTADLDVE